MDNEVKEILIAVLAKLDTMDAKIEGGTNKVDTIEKNLIEFKNEMYAFRKETNERFDHVDRQLRFLDADMDHMNKEIADNKREIQRVRSTR